MPPGIFASISPGPIISVTLESSTLSKNIWGWLAQALKSQPFNAIHPFLYHHFGGMNIHLHHLLATFRRDMIYIYIHVYMINIHLYHTYIYIYPMTSFISIINPSYFSQITREFHGFPGSHAASAENLFVRSHPAKAGTPGDPVDGA